MGLWLACAWSAGDWSFFWSAPASGEASAVAVMVGEALGEGASSASAVVPDPATRSPSVSATASRLRRARNEVCVTVIVRTVLTHEG